MSKDQAHAQENPITLALSPNGGEGAAVWFRGVVIAAVLGLTKKTVHTRAQEEGWPTRRLGNRHEYQPPDEIAALCMSASEPEKPLR